MEKGVDFRVPGVIIWSERNARSKHNGLGYPNQGFDVDNVEEGEPYTCDDGNTTTSWSHGQDVQTKVTGWVPRCNLIIVD